MRERLSASAVIEQGLTTVHRIWVAEVATTAALLLLLPRLVQPLGSQSESAALLVLLFSFISLVDLAVGWWFKSQVLAQASRTPASSAEDIVSRLLGPSLIAVVLPMTPALLAVVLYVLTGLGAAFAGLCMLSLAGLLVLRPRLEEWQEVANRTPIHADRSP